MVNYDAYMKTQGKDRTGTITMFDQFATTFLANAATLGWFADNNPGYPYMSPDDKTSVVYNNSYEVRRYYIQVMGEKLLNAIVEQFGWDCSNEHPDNVTKEELLQISRDGDLERYICLVRNAWNQWTPPPTASPTEAPTDAPTHFPTQKPTLPPCHRVIQFSGVGTMASEGVTYQVIDGLFGTRGDLSIRENSKAARSGVTGDAKIVAIDGKPSPKDPQALSDKLHTYDNTGIPFTVTFVICHHGLLPHKIRLAHSGNDNW